MPHFHFPTVNDGITIVAETLEEAQAMIERLRNPGKPVEKKEPKEEIKK